jgi:MFS family permease
VCVYLLGAILYGVDTGSFGSLQALPSFTKKFGYYDSTLKAYTLRTGPRAAMNSIPFAGQALGAFLSSNVVDQFGYKYTMVVLALIQIVAIIVELTSNLSGSWVRDCYAVMIRGTNFTRDNLLLVGSWPTLPLVWQRCMRIQEAKNCCGTANLFVQGCCALQLRSGTCERTRPSK